MPEYYVNYLQIIIGKILFYGDEWNEFVTKYPVLADSIFKAHSEIKVCVSSSSSDARLDND